MPLVTGFESCISLFESCPNLMGSSGMLSVGQVRSLFQQVQPSMAHISFARWKQLLELVARTVYAADGEGA